MAGSRSASGSRSSSGRNGSRRSGGISDENIDSKAHLASRLSGTTRASSFAPLMDSSTSNRQRAAGSSSRSARQTTKVERHDDTFDESSSSRSQVRRSHRPTSDGRLESQDDELESSQRQEEDQTRTDEEHSDGEQQRAEGAAPRRGVRQSGTSKRRRLTGGSPEGSAPQGSRRIVSHSPSSVGDTSHNRSHEEGNEEGGEDDEEGEGDEEDEDDGRARRHRVEARHRRHLNAPAFKRDSDGFVHGSIVRVKLTNFVTYDDVEFFPGPHLNMIVGPNGTGKSTIASALCLGLGWKPHILGRANDVASYVKQGAENGSTEVELKNVDGPNFVIGRSITRASSTSLWSLNGRASSARAISELVEKLGIDMGNLCCFLPQDRVADFARMSPPELLRETQKAAGSPAMLAWHDQLIDLGRQAASASKAIATEREECVNLENRNEQMERDVRRAERRHELEIQLKVLAIRIAIAEYTEAQVRYKKYKDLRNKHKDTFNQLKDILSPLDEKLESVGNVSEKLKLKINDVSKAIETLIRDLKRIHRAHESLTTEYETMQDKQSTLKAKEEQRRKVIERLARDIEELQQDIGEQPDVGDTSAIDAELRNLREAARGIEESLSDKNNELDDLHSTMRQLQNKKTATLQDLGRMDNVKERRLADLEKKDAHTAKAVRWLRKNQHLFEKKVHEPIMLELSVPNPENAAAVEAVINWNLMRTFVCETRADYDTFYRLVKAEGFRVNAYEWGDGKSLAAFLQERPQGAEQKIRNLGFDSYLFDMIEGPDAVLRCLCHKTNLHLIPATRRTNVNPDAVQNSEICRRYIIGTQQYNVSRSEYGSRQFSMTSQSFKPARIFTLSVDINLKRKLDAEMRQIAEQTSEIEAQSSATDKEVKKLKERREKAKARQEELKGQKIDANKARTQWEKRRVTLATKRNLLEEERKKPTAQVEQERLTQRLRKLNNDMIGHARKMKDLMVVQVQRRQEYELLMLDLAQNKSKYESLRSLKKHNQDFLKDAQDALEKAAEQLTKAKEHAIRCRAEASQLVGDSDEEVVRRNEEEDANPSRRDRPLHEIQHEHMEVSVEIESTVEISPGIMEAYNRRKNEIKKLQANILKRDREKAKLDSDIRKVEELWLPALDVIRDSVNNNFTRAFSKLGCAGEVHISRNDDYEKWGMDILVKFRDTEQLQLLTAQRQSGGERSLSTILYLMSLLELSRSPFSLVDEINQGMDQRAERAVHDQMVDVTCREGAGQYFLITPKLLPHLKYHDLMRVLIINNGEWLPETFSFSHYIGARKRKRGLGDGAVNGFGGRAVASAS